MTPPRMMAHQAYEILPWDRHQDQRQLTRRTTPGLRREDTG